MRESHRWLVDLLLIILIVVAVLGMVALVHFMMVFWLS